MRRVDCELVYDDILVVPDQSPLGDNTGAIVHNPPTVCDYMAVRDKTDGHGIVIVTDLKENLGADIRDSECIDKIVAAAAKDGLKAKNLNLYVQDEEGWMHKVHHNEPKVDGEYVLSPVQREYVQAEIAPLRLEPIRQSTDPQQGPPLAEAIFGDDSRDVREDAAFQVVAEKKQEYVRQHQDDLEQSH